jgi:hypothetical protein
MMASSITGLGDNSIVVPLVTPEVIEIKETVQKEKTEASPSVRSGDETAQPSCLNKKRPEGVRSEA